MHELPDGSMIDLRRVVRISNTKYDWDTHTTGSGWGCRVTGYTHTVKVTIDVQHLPKPIVVTFVEESGTGAEFSKIEKRMMKKAKKAYAALLKSWEEANAKQA